MTKKLIITVPDEIAAEARAAVRAGEAKSVSAYIVTALEYYRRAITMDEWLAQADADAGGPPSEEVFARIDRLLGLKPEDKSA